MLFPWNYVWNMLKDYPNRIMENITGYAQTLCKIHEDIISLYSKRFLLLQPVW